MTIRTPPLLLCCSLLLAACDNSVRDIEPPPGPPPPAARLWTVPDGAAALSAANATAFGAGQLYFNAHTPAHPSGEIRGQLDHGGTVKLASLGGSQEVAAPATAAFGAGALAVDEATGAVSGFVVTSGLAGTAAHVHGPAARGANGPVLVPLAGGPDLWVVPDGAAPLTAAQVADFVAGRLYFNVHTAANPGGEIRGQIDKAGTVKLAALDGAQAGVTTGAFGYGLLAVDTATGAVAGFVNASGLAGTLAHVHLSSGRGVSGGVVVPMSAGPGLWVVPDGAPALAAASVTAFQAGQLYFNVHTAAHPGGEIRGQIDHGGTLRLAVMSGGQEAPNPVATAAFGAGVLAVDAGPTSVAGFIHTFGLVSPTAAHVHAAAARSATAAVAVPLAP